MKVAHGTIGILGGASKALGLLPKVSDALGGLPKVTTVITAPLDFGAGTANDISNGKDPGEAVLGNAIRQGLVVGSGAAGEFLGALGGGTIGSAIPGAGTVAGAGVGGTLGWSGGQALANQLLPDGATIGHGVIQLLKNPPTRRLFPSFSGMLRRMKGLALLVS